MKDNQEKERKNEPQKTRAQKDAEFLEWYKKEQKPFFQVLKGFARPILLIPVCIIIAYYLTNCCIGNGAYKYNNNVYLAMERAIQHTLVPGKGVDLFSLQTQDIYFDPMYIGKEEEEQDASKIEINFDENEYPDRPRTMTTVKTEYENGHTVLTCSVKDGFFEAKITTKLDEQHEFVKWERNFKTFDAYLLYFRFWFGFFTIGGGVLLYLALEGLNYLRLWRKWKSVSKRVNAEGSKEPQLGEELPPTSEGPVFGEGTTPHIPITEGAA